MKMFLTALFRSGSSVQGFQNWNPIFLSSPLAFYLAASPFLPLQFDANVPNCSLPIRLVQGFPTIASELKSDVSFSPQPVFLLPHRNFFVVRSLIPALTQHVIYSLVRLLIVVFVFSILYTHTIVAFVCASGSSFLCPHVSRCVRDGTTVLKWVDSFCQIVRRGTHWMRLVPAVGTLVACCCTIPWSSLMVNFGSLAFGCVQSMYLVLAVRVLANWFFISIFQWRVSYTVFSLFLFFNTLIAL